MGFGLGWDGAMGRHVRGCMGESAFGSGCWGRVERLLAAVVAC